MIKENFQKRNYMHWLALRGSFKIDCNKTELECFINERVGCDQRENAKIVFMIYRD